MTNCKTALLLGPDDMLRQAVEHLITESKDWKVIGIWDEYGVDVLIKEIGRKKPDVVIVNQGDFAGELDLPIQLLENYPHLKIITVSLKSNLIEIYNKQMVSVKEASDLLSIIDQCLDQFQTRKEMINKP